MKKIVICLAICLSCLAGTANAMEDKYHFGLFLNGEQEMTETINFNYHVTWPNYVGSQLPYTYLGLGHSFSEQVYVEGMVGYGFEAEEDDSGIVYAMAPVFNFDQLSWYNDIEYWSGTEVIFSCHSWTYPVGKVRVGLDNANFYYLNEEDAESRFYRIGPSLRIPMGEHSTVGMMYFYQFENDGMDANLFKLTLSLGL